MRITEASMPPIYDIKTEHLHLRPYTWEDLDAHVAILAEWEVSRWLANAFPFPYSMEDGEKFIVQNEKDFKDGTKIRFSVNHLETGDHVGSLLIFDVKSEESEIGYWIAPAFWGKGFGTEIMVAAIEWIKSSGAVKTLFAQTATENKGSRRILEKVGFTHKGAPPPDRARCGHGVTCSEYYELDLIKRESNE